MRTINLYFLLVIIILIIPISIQAQGPSGPGGSPTSTFGSVGVPFVTANIITPLEINKVTDLYFGNIAAGPSTGTVTIETDGNRSGTGGITLIEAGSIINAASFSIYGYPEASFTITLPVAITIESNGNEMNVFNFISSLGAMSNLNIEGSSNLTIGATLNVDANQEPGLYSGNFDVVVAYN